MKRYFTDMKGMSFYKDGRIVIDGKVKKRMLRKLDKVMDWLTKEVGKK